MPLYLKCGSMAHSKIKESRLKYLMVKRILDKKSSATQQALPSFMYKRLLEGTYILVLALSIYLFLSLATYTAADPTWRHLLKNKDAVNNAGGWIGAYLADFFYWIFGYIAYVLPVTSAYLAGLLVQESKHALLNKWFFFLRSSGFVLLILSACALFGLNPTWVGPDGVPGAGGLLGAFLADGFDGAVSRQGAAVLLIAIILMGITWLTGFSWIAAVDKMGEAISRGFVATARFVQSMYCIVAKKLATRNSQLSSKPARLKLPSFKTEDKPKLVSAKILTEKSPTVVAKPERAKELQQETGVHELAAEPIVFVNKQREEGTLKPETDSKKKASSSVSVTKHLPGLPNLSLLDAQQHTQASQAHSPQVLEQLSREVEQHLLDFGIHADVVAVHPGPVITRFELQLAAGIKVSRLTALAKDLARALSVISVRVVEVIPGKTVVGLELPNQHREIVRLSRVLYSDVYQQAHSPLTLALGVDIAGYPMVVDLAKMPHLLVAGTTGSGKSVGVNAMILSLLFKSTPEQVRLIMIDPKMLELSIYDGIPHLLTPVVTDMKEAAGALRWCVGEMEKRYRLLASVGVRNLVSFNQKVNDAIAQGQPILDPTVPGNGFGGEETRYLQPLPYIVVVIDELADMMMVVGKKVEQLIARIAQKARAAGIHLILATQRPSVDVLTGLIKSNIPTRISFQVSSKIDSRTILDQQGAEQLLGHGDMLFLAPGTGAPLRVHGAFVDDAEVHRVAEDWRSRGQPVYIDEITNAFNEDAGEDAEDNEADPLYDEAVAFVVENKKGSISAVQRRFKIGYNRAARLVETMESSGILGPLEGGSREVLVPGGGA